MLGFTPLSLQEAHGWVRGSTLEKWATVYPGIEDIDSYLYDYHRLHLSMDHWVV
eukprot:gene1308-1487_t